jgi:hypothetical protein
MWVSSRDEVSSKAADYILEVRARGLAKWSRIPPARPGWQCNPHTHTPCTFNWLGHTTPTGT